MSQAHWNCKSCHWTGAQPSISDASYAYTNREGETVVDRVHIAICPVCFQAVRRETIADTTGEFRRVKAVA